MDQDEHIPADPTEQGESPFGPRPNDGASDSPPPIALLPDDDVPLQPYPAQTCSEAVIALVLAIVGISGTFFCCFGMLSIWLELGALMLAVSAKHKIKANPYLAGEGLATAAISIALVMLTLYALMCVGWIFLLGFAG